MTAPQGNAGEIFTLIQTEYAEEIKLLSSLTAIDTKRLGEVVMLGKMLAVGLENGATEESLRRLIGWAEHLVEQIAYLSFLVQGIADVEVVSKKGLRIKCKPGFHVTREQRPEGPEK